MTETKIKKGPPKRNPACYQTARDIIIPAGSIFRQAANERGGIGFVEIPIGHGKDFASYHVVQIHADAEASGIFRKVTVA